jgi:hypothetical protein
MENVIVYLTDKNGGQMFKNYTSKLYIDSAIRELQNHINQAKKYPKIYHFCDIKSLEIKIENIN